MRTNCIFCKNELKTHLFSEDLEAYVAHYAVDKSHNSSVAIPFNVLQCDNCLTLQLKYLGDVNEVYKINHADATGTTMKRMHDEFLNLILKHRDKINNIIEIGSSVGILADCILEKLKTEYNIIEPKYFGNIDNKNIINDFYENVDDSNIEANTFIMSHVFEHFYEPLEILKKIQDNKNIENIFLTFPNLEQYVINDINHVLDTEHTFYIDNQFLKKIFMIHGFESQEDKFFEDHSVMLYFKRSDKYKSEDIILKNEKHNLEGFFKKIKDKVGYFNNIIESNKGKNIYLFPASCHSIYLSIFGFKHKNIKGMVDNSPNKIGKKMYGLDCEIFSFKEVVENDTNAVFLINGGTFNSEVLDDIIKNKREYYLGENNEWRS
jgi:hypothetical protein